MIVTTFVSESLIQDSVHETPATSGDWSTHLSVTNPVTGAMLHNNDETTINFECVECVTHNRDWPGIEPGSHEWEPNLKSTRPS